MRRRDVSQLGFGKTLLFALLPTCCLLLVAELAVRASGAAERCSAYQGSFLWACDPILYFKPNPNQGFKGQRLINQAGFRSREFTSKRSGVYRILALGDSCTFGVIANKAFYIDEPYPQRLERLIAERIGPDHVEVFNAGVPGYNTYQGVMLLRTKLRGLHPDLLTVRFGWNDLLMSPERHIGNAFREPPTAAGLFVQDLLLHTALYPFSQRLGMEVRSRFERGAGPPSLPTTWQPNIPLDEYKHNLRRFVELGQAMGAEVWLLTAPDAFGTPALRGQYQEFPPSSDAGRLLAMNALGSFDRLIAIHAAYNTATREVGTELGVPVIDMAAAYATHAGGRLFEPGDVVHPNEAGHALEAEVLGAELAARGVLTRTAAVPRDGQ